MNRLDKDLNFPVRIPGTAETVEQGMRVIATSPNEIQRNVV